MISVYLTNTNHLADCDLSDGDITIEKYNSSSYQNKIKIHPDTRLKQNYITRCLEYIMITFVGGELVGNTVKARKGKVESVIFSVRTSLHPACGPHINNSMTSSHAHSCSSIPVQRQYLTQCCHVKMQILIHRCELGPEILHF